MFENIGKKIKGLAEAIFIIEAVLGGIAGIVLMALGEYLILVGLAVAFVMPFFAWISAWLLYGFGELIDKTADIAKNTEKLYLNFNQNPNSAVDLEKETITPQDSQAGTATTAAVKKEISSSLYECDSIEIAQKTSSGHCFMCHAADENLKNCKISNSIGTRKIAICNKCVERFKANCSEQ